ncbi:MAG: PAS domain-containing protein [Alphaproteobacteria bacterium]|nr:PAS domain-containing protein [Alphaproteobacteria bacterium]MDE1985658.1 PAS domain-containing protein [Alphaproteobacteria bacterium]MDE2161851.1 PAS domain-containing protein [Alphaproteobacteria bacterium]
MRLLEQGQSVMSYQEFEQSIVAPALKQVARHWNDVRGSRIMPGWTDIRPSQITAQLPIIWSYRYDRVADAFTGRLAGDQIEQIFGKNFRGSPMSTLYPADEFPRLFARSKRLVCEPALYWGEGMVFKHVDHYGHGERIMMPLADDGVLGDGILGATQYQSFRGVRRTDIPEHERWFTL